jgi:predicted phosphodiesterase
MTKVAIISDTHWGVRGDNSVFMDMTKSFLDNIFFPTIIKEKIDTVIHLGDLVDRRKQISFLTARRLRVDFLDKMEQHKLRGHFIVGNHDCHYKNTNDINALTELGINSNPLISIYTKASELAIFDQKILLLPWICDENREHSINLLQSTNADLCMGHLEIQGFEMYRGSIATHGEDRSIFDKFDMTLSGHYHHRSTDGSITYVGSHGEFTWSDYDDPRGFHILDLATRELTFHQNPYKMFSKIWYSDKDKSLDQLLEFNSDSISNRFLKLIVSSKENPYWFDLFCGKVEKSNPIGMQIVEDHLNLNLEDTDDIINEAESTLDIFKKHIDQIQSKSMDKAKLEKLIVDLYNQAIAVET